VEVLVEYLCQNMGGREGVEINQVQEIWNSQWWHNGDCNGRGRTQNARENSIKQSFGRKFGIYECSVSFKG
jgi:hypothetical protein